MSRDKLGLYFTYDVGEAEVLDFVIECLRQLGIFDIFVSPSTLSELVRFLDSERKDRIENCDILIALITRRSLRWGLLEKEIAFARTKNKIIVPIVNTSVRISGVGTLTEYDKVVSLSKDGLELMHEIACRLAFLQNILHISEESIRKARARSLVHLTIPSEPFERTLAQASRRAMLCRMIVETLQSIHYTIDELKSYRNALPIFDMTAKRNGQRIGIKCLLHMPTEKQINKIVDAEKRMGLSAAWIVCISVPPAYRVGIEEAHDVRIIEPNELFEELESKNRRRFKDSYARLLDPYPSVPLGRYAELRELLRKLPEAQTPVHKGKSFESITESFIKMVPELEIVGRNVRIESEELDLVVKNENKRLFWQRLGSPIIVECKNWSVPVDAKEIRDLVQKMREVKTAFLIAAKGITAKNGAYDEILEARKNSKIILTFDMQDIKDVAMGTNVESIVADRFYSLWTGIR
jgi:hypothetical protein